MAVKNRELVNDNENQLDLATLVHYIQLIVVQQSDLPPHQELLQFCKDIVKCLAATPIPKEFDRQATFQLKVATIKMFLQRIASSVPYDSYLELFDATVKSLYLVTTSENTDASPVTCIVLYLIKGTDRAKFALRLIIECESNGAACTSSLQSLLNTFYRWIYSWRCCTFFVQTMYYFMNALRIRGNVDMLIEVSLDSIDQLFDVLLLPYTKCVCAAQILFYALASLRELEVALEKIAPKIKPVSESLARDSRQGSRQILQTLVDITGAFVSYNLKRCNELSPSAVEELKEKYSELICYLERHMTSDQCKYLSLKAWHIQEVTSDQPLQTLTFKRIGIINFGNTCYVNSIMQALLLNRQFMTYAMQKPKIQQWNLVGNLFARMMYSRTKIDPRVVYNQMIPKHFNKGVQHDSSEFLVHFLECLHTCEKYVEKGGAGQAPGTSKSSTVLNCLENKHVASESSSKLTPNSTKLVNLEDVALPTAGGSCDSSSRMDESALGPSPPKRRRLSHNEIPVLDSFINKIFGGILHIRIKCKDCHSSSYRHEIFRDLQLCFPEKPIDGQHSVQNLIDYFFSPELLLDSNRYQCTGCSKLCDAERTVSIEVSPKYLNLVLKHFKFEPKHKIQKKLLYSVNYNKTIELSTIRSERVSYNLYAAVVHTGTSIDSGHYYTIARDGTHWFTFDDEKVKPTSEAAFNKLSSSSTPYILFYRRSDIEEGTQPVYEELPPHIHEVLKSPTRE